MIIQNKNIVDIFKKYNVYIKDVNDIELYRIALYHPSMLYNDHNKNEKKNQTYERLEFLGDTVFKLILSNYIFDRYDKMNEGFMTKLKIKIENRKSLSKMNKIIGLNKFIEMSQNLKVNNGKNNDKILEDSFESFICAIYLDLGFDLCKSFIYSLLNSEINFSELIYNDENYKD